MADTTITSLPGGSTPLGPEKIVIDQNGVTKNLSLSDLFQQGGQETLTSLSLVNGTLSYTDEAGVVSNLDINVGDFVSKAGDIMTGDLGFTQPDLGIQWVSSSDNASIRFHTDGDSSSENRLEFQVGDNVNEYFVFTRQPWDSERVELLKISNSEISYKGVDLLTQNSGSIEIGSDWDTNTPTGGDKLFIKWMGTERVDYDPYGEGADIAFNLNYAIDKNRFPLIITDNNDTTEGPNSHGILLYNASGAAGSFAPSILFASREAETTDYRTAISGIYSRTPLAGGGASGGDDWSDGELIFATSGVLAGTTANSKGLSQRMVIDRAGRVGINTTTPTEILDVDGNITATGNITMDNTRASVGFYPAVEYRVLLNNASTHIGNYASTNSRGFLAVLNTKGNSETDAGGLFIGTKDENGDESAILCFNQGTAEAGGRAGEIFNVTTAGNVFVAGDITATNATFDSLNYTTANDGDYLIYDNSQSKFVATQSNIVFTKSFESAEQNVPATNAAVLTISHGLGEIPKFMEMVYRCKTNDNGWIAGDEIVTHSQSDSSFGHWSVVKNITEVKFRGVSNKRRFAHGTSNTAFTPDSPNWKIVFRAYA